MTSKTIRIAAVAIAVVLLVSLVVCLFQLLAAKRNLAVSLEQAEGRNQLLNQKYKEEKALSGRLQREALTLNGQARQVKMDLEKVEAEKVQLREERNQMENKFADCDQEKIRLSETIGRLEASLGETTIQLKGLESKNAALNDQIKELSVNLRASESQAKRYFTHNQRLSEIAKTLVAQVEKEKMGSSVMVKEPLIQFKRVELENMLQEYLDGIDSAKIVQ